LGRWVDPRELIEKSVNGKKTYTLPFHLKKNYEKGEYIIESIDVYELFPSENPAGAAHPGDSFSYRNSSNETKIKLLERGIKRSINIEDTSD